LEEQGPIKTSKPGTPATQGVHKSKTSLDNIKRPCIKRERICHLGRVHKAAYLSSAANPSPSPLLHLPEREKGRERKRERGREREKKKKNHW
jgi:hypothetical protein